MTRRKPNREFILVGVWTDPETGWQWATYLCDYCGADGKSRREEQYPRGKQPPETRRLYCEACDENLPHTLTR